MNQFSQHKIFTLFGRSGSLRTVKRIHHLYTLFDTTDIFLHDKVTRTLAGLNLTLRIFQDQIDSRNIIADRSGTDLHFFGDLIGIDAPAVI